MDSITNRKSKPHIISKHKSVVNHEDVSSSILCCMHFPVLVHQADAHRRFNIKDSWQHCTLGIGLSFYQAWWPIIGWAALLTSFEITRKCLHHRSTLTHIRLLHVSNCWKQPDMGWESTSDMSHTQTRETRYPCLMCSSLQQSRPHAFLLILSSFTKCPRWCIIMV